MDHPREGRLLEPDLTPPPNPQAQLEFLAKVQRLFSEGDFTATYKFALLMTLADLAVERGRDDGEGLLLPLKAVGHKFIELYWQQTSPFTSAGDVPFIVEG